MGIPRIRTVMCVGRMEIGTSLGHLGAEREQVLLDPEIQGVGSRASTK